MLVVNFFGAPCAGKSAAALAVAGLLKRSGVNAEYVSEFAKDQVWTDSAHMLQHQNWLFANQELRLRVLEGKVDVAVTDAPLLLSAFYAPAGYPASFQTLCFEMCARHRNVNFYLRREHAHSHVGRLQDEPGCDEIDSRLRSFLARHGVAFEELGSDQAPPEILVARLGLAGAAR